VKHGIAKRVEGGEIAISAARENGELRVSVRNDGPAFAEGWHLKKGIGLENVRERLASLYGESAAVRVLNGDGVVVTIVVPYRDEEIAGGR
jgi:sensor histidine kinase YesM